MSVQSEYTSSVSSKISIFKNLNDYLTLYITMTSNWYIIEDASSKRTYIHISKINYNFILENKYDLLFLVHKTLKSFIEIWFEIYTSPYNKK